MINRFNRQKAVEYVMRVFNFGKYFDYCGLSSHTQLLKSSYKESI